MVLFTQKNNIFHLQSNGKPGEAIIVSESLEQFASGDPVRVRNFSEESDKWNLIPRDSIDFRKQCIRLLSREVYYSLDRCNCEHFATFMRYGRAFSNQARMLSGLKEVRDVTHLITNSKLVRTQVLGDDDTDSLANMTITLRVVIHQHTMDLLKTDYRGFSQTICWKFERIQFVNF